MATSPLRVHILASSPLVRDGLRALLAQHDDFVVTAGERAVRREQLAAAASSECPDVFLFTLHGTEAAHPDVPVQIGMLARTAPVLVLAPFEDRGQVETAVNFGAHGCVAALSSSDILIEALRRVGAKHGYFCPAVADVVVATTSAARSAASPPATPLSAREHQVLSLVAQGHTSAQIALKLSLSVKTVNAHRANLMRKLGTHNAAMLLREAIRRGLVTE